MDFWWPDLKEFMAKRKGASDWRAAIREGSFATYLSDFLVHRDGGENKDKFTFERELVCGEPASGIKVRNSKLLRFYIYSSIHASKGNI